MMALSHEQVIRKFIKGFSEGDYIRFEEPDAFPSQVRGQILNFETDMLDKDNAPIVQVHFLDGKLSGKACYVLMLDIVKYCVNETRETKKKIGMWKEGLSDVTKNEV